MEIGIDIYRKSQCNHARDEKQREADLDSASQYAFLLAILAKIDKYGHLMLRSDYKSDGNLLPGSWNSPDYSHVNMPLFQIISHLP